MIIVILYDDATIMALNPSIMSVLLCRARGVRLRYCHHTLEDMTHGSPDDIHLSLKQSICQRGVHALDSHVNKKTNIGHG